MVGGASTLNTAATIDANVAGNATTLGSGFTSTINNTGTIRSSNGNNLSVQPTNFNNAGTVDAGVGTTITLGSGEVQSGGTTRVNGNLALAASTSLVLNGGTLSGNGTIGSVSGTISVLNNGGTVSPGNSPGTLALNGNYTQGAAGSLFIDLASASSSDLFNVGGSAALDGTLDINLFGGFAPTLGESFTFLNYASHTGTFAHIVSLNPGYGYSVAYNANNAVISVTEAALSTPEPGVWAMLAGLGLTTVSVLRRRKR